MSTSENFNFALRFIADVLPREPEPETRAEQIPIVMMRAVGRFPIPYGAVPAHNPHTHMPMQMEPQQHQMPPPPPPTQQEPQQQTQRLYPQPILIRHIQLPAQVQFQIQQQQQQQRAQELQQRNQEQHQRIQEHEQRMEEQRMHEEQQRFREQQQRIQAEQERVQSEQRIQLPQQFNAPPPPFYAIRHNMPITVHRMPEPNQMLTAPQREEPRPIANFQIGEQQPQGIVQSIGPHGVQLQRVPLSLALQRVGITPDDLRNIQRMAESRIQQEMQQLAADYSEGSAGPSSSSSSPSESSSSSSSSSASSSFHAEDSSEESSEETNPNSEDSDDSSQILQIGRSAFGRSVVTPIRIPVDLMQAIKQVEGMAAAKIADDSSPAHDGISTIKYKWFGFKSAFKLFSFLSSDAPIQGPIRISPDVDEAAVADTNNNNNEESQH